jgi:hypothetical protein
MNRAIPLFALPLLALGCALPEATPSPGFAKAGGVDLKPLAAPASIDMQLSSGLLRVRVVAVEPMTDATLSLSIPPGARTHQPTHPLGKLAAGEAREVEVRVFGDGQGDLVAGVFTDTEHGRAATTTSIWVGDTKAPPQRVETNYRGLKVRAERN